LGAAVSCLASNGSVAIPVPAVPMGMPDGGLLVPMDWIKRTFGVPQ
jgi:hypothetical protein